MGFLGDFWDDITGQSAIEAANAANEARYQQILDIFDQLQRQQGVSGKKQQKVLGKAGQKLGERLTGAEQRAATALQTGFGQAHQLAREQGRTAERGILRRGEQRSAQASAGLQAAGLGSTTRSANLQRAVGQDTDFALGNLSEKIAGLRSGIAEREGTALGGLRQQMGTQRAMARYGAATNLAQLLGQLSQQRQQLGLGRIGVIEGREDLVGPSPLTQFAELAKGIGSIMGGGMA